MTATKADEPLLSTREAARRLGVSVGRIRRLIKDGRLQASKLGTRDHLIPESEVRNYKPRPSGAAGHIRRRRAATPKKPKAQAA